MQEDFDGSGFLVLDSQGTVAIVEVFSGLFREKDGEARMTGAVVLRTREGGRKGFIAPRSIVQQVAANIAAQVANATPGARIEKMTTVHSVTPTPGYKPRRRTRLKGRMRRIA